MDTQDALTEKSKSNLQKYRQLVIGEGGYGSLVKYELIVLASAWLPGALGLFLRSKLYPLLLAETGKGVVFGTNVVLRHPRKVALQDRVVLDDNAVLDAKGAHNNGIRIGHNVFVGRNTIIYCQDGDIEIRDDTNIGSNCQIFSAGRVQIGKKVLIAAYSYIVGGDHNHDDPDIPIIDQGRSAAGVIVEDNVWLGAGVKVLDGVRIGEGSIIAAGAVVTDDIPPNSIAGGIPCRVLRSRK